MYVCCWCCCKCCCKCWKCFGHTMVSIQSSHTSPSKCKCSSPSRNLVMFPFNSMALLPQLSLMWQCHLWYFLPLLLRPSFLWKCQLWYCCNLSNLHVPLLALQMVPLYPSSSSMSSNMCFHVPSSLLSLRLLLPQLCSSSWEHLLERLLQLSFCSPVLFTSPP